MVKENILRKPIVLSARELNVCKAPAGRGFKNNQLLL